MENLIERTRAVLSTTPGRWTSLVNALPGDLLTLPPATGQWSALDCLQHLIDTEPVFLFRIKCFQAGEDFPAYDPDSQGTRPNPSQSPPALAEEFTRLRGKSLAALDALEPDNLDRQVRHAELGPVRLDEFLHEWGGHDLMHTVQAEQALLQPFIRGCGPWRIYFEAHDVKQAPADSE